ncbi:MAG: DUF4956 domain-containing protein [Planctomycetota bacterium]
MEFLEVPLFDDDIYKLLVRFGINLSVLLAVVCLCYRPKQSSSNSTTYRFTFILMNVIIFFICFALKKIDLGLGMALGLFAIFAIIRFRTDAIPVKEMTYLFVVVGVAVINSLSNKKTSYSEIAVTNMIIVGGALVLENIYVQARKPSKFNLVYDRLELLADSRRGELLEDLSQRTGMQFSTIKIGKIDLQKGNVNLTASLTEEPDTEQDSSADM